MRDARGASCPPSFDDWLADSREYVATMAPELLSLFDIYAGEASFGRNFIQSDLAALPLGALILEVGAGALLLSCQLQQEGFRVTALEPLAHGFSHFGQLRSLVLERADAKGIRPTIQNLPAEEMADESKFDYAFSINVMEHVTDVAKVLAKVVKSLKHGARYHFTCPNYLFPYEPHFNMPTLFSKRLTERFFANRIFKNTTLPDPTGTWRSLNWISVRQISKISGLIPGVRLSYSRRLLASTLERLQLDKEFAARRSAWIRGLVGCLVRLRLHKLLIFLPAIMMPIIDCTVIRHRRSGR